MSRHQSDTSAAKALSIRNVRKVYKSRGREEFEAVKGMDLDIRPGEMISVEIPAGTLGVASTAGEPFEISLNAAGEGVK